MSGDTWVSEPELEDVVGREATRLLCATYGGIATYVPVAPQAEHPLARLMGMRALEALCARYGGQSIVTPNGRRKAARKLIPALRKRGMQAQEIALECGVTERYVRLVLAEQQASTGPAQGRLPGIAAAVTRARSASVTDGDSNV